MVAQPGQLVLYAAKCLGIHDRTHHCERDEGWNRDDGGGADRVGLLCLQHLSDTTDVHSLHCEPGAVRARVGDHHHRSDLSIHDQDPGPWSFAGLLMPLSCVLYPVSSLPSYLRPIALMLPTTHAFEGMRQA